MPFVTVEAVPQTTTTQYTAGDAVGNTFMFPNVVRGPGLGGEIRSIVLVEKGTTQAASGTAYFFRQNPNAAVVDNAAYALAATDGATAFGFVPLVTYPATAPATSQIAMAAGVGLAFQCTPGSSAIWCQLQTNGTPTYAANGLFFSITVYYE